MYAIVCKIPSKLVKSRERRSATPEGVYVSLDRCYGGEIERLEWSGLK